MPGKKRRWKYQYIAAAVLLVAIIAIVRARQSGGVEPIIRTAKVEMGTVTATVSANGTLQAFTTVQVKSNVAGQIVKLAVDEGDMVKAGQLIARIDPTDTRTAFEQSQADLAAAISKVYQAQQQRTMQNIQNSAQIESARRALAAARIRLEQAQAQARVQPSLTRAAIEQAQNNYEAAQAAIDQTSSALVPQKLASAQAGFDQAKASFDAAERENNRQKELLAKGFVSKSQADAAEEKYEVAKAQLDSVREKLKTIKSETDQDIKSAKARAQQAKAELDNAKANKIQDKLKQQEASAADAAVRQVKAALDAALAAGKYNDPIRQGDITQAQATVTRQQAAFQNAQTQLGYTTIVAPRAGIVTKKYVEEGSIVTAGRSSFAGSGAGVGIVDIADVSRMYALVSVDETDIGQIKVGQEVDITVEAYPDELFTGKVTKIAPQSVMDQNVTTIPVTVELKRPDPRLKPGMNATCDFITGRRRNVLMAPNEAVKESDSGGTVTVILGDKQVERKVKIGLAGKDYTEIKRGLKKGDTVVTAIIQPMGAGQPSGMPGGMGGPGMGGMGGRGGRRGM
ncbi:MAG: efflux RND transporter periplasmic adaptor subunit [Armatimonadetes bacterium]|nr:efflux RND transporter periplasmic adaptor subunit [Armatimonadota bacterium]